MALYQCKACGAPLEVRDGTEVAFCPYCGMKQTLPKDPVQVMSDGTSVESLLKRAFMFLEDGNWRKANEYCDRVLDIEPENARAYLCKFMADYHVRRREDIATGDYPFVFDKNDNYKKILRFGDKELISELEGYLARTKATIALDDAIKRNDIENVNALLNAGASVNAKFRDGCTALYRAASYGSKMEIINALLKAGADINTKNIDGYTALMTASGGGHTEIVNALLNAGANVNAKGRDGATALISAALQGRTEIVNALLNAGANVNAKFRDGSTALMLATLGGHMEIVNILKSRSPTQTTTPTQPTTPAPASGCMTLILQALTATIIITILAAYL